MKLQAGRSKYSFSPHKSEYNKSLYNFRKIIPFYFD